MKAHKDVMAPALLIVEQPAGRLKTGPRFIRRLIAERCIEYHKVGRHVAFPGELVPELRWHLEQFTEPGERGCVFVGPKGGRLRRSNFRPIWHSARMAVNLPDLHFHDLRHTGGPPQHRVHTRAIRWVGAWLSGAFRTVDSFDCGREARGQSVYFSLSHKPQSRLWHPKI